MYDKMIIVPQIFNSLSMIVPFFSWWRHRKTHSHNGLHKILRVHIPLSALYHLTAAFGFPISNLLRAIDIFFVHMQGIASGREIINLAKCRHHKQIAYVVLGASTIIHYITYRKNMTDDLSMSRYLLIMFNNSSLYSIRRDVFWKLMMYGAISYKLYFLDNKICVGHALFHCMLFFIYNAYFGLFV